MTGPATGLMERFREWIEGRWIVVAVVVLVLAMSVLYYGRERENQRLLAACMAEGKRTPFECELAIQQLREQQRLADAILQGGGRVVR